jgi:hypothetical protein
MDRHQRRDELMKSKASRLYVDLRAGWSTLYLQRGETSLQELEELPWQLHCAAVDEGTTVGAVGAGVREEQRQLAEELIAEIIAEEQEEEQGHDAHST